MILADCFCLFQSASPPLCMLLSGDHLTIDSQEISLRDHLVVQQRPSLVGGLVAIFEIFPYILGF